MTAVNHIDDLNAFIVRAKARTYAGDGATRASSRRGSHDLGHDEGEWAYLDSYFGGTDFLGQEVVWRNGEPVWAMNYYGRILDPALIDAARAGAIIKEALSELYREDRFLGGFEWSTPHGIYRDASDGTAASFTGREGIFVDGVEAYRLDYCGGLIKP
jgi:hypothetical protein